MAIIIAVRLTLTSLIKVRIVMFQLKKIYPNFFIVPTTIALTDSGSRGRGSRCGSRCGCSCRKTNITSGEITIFETFAWVAGIAPCSYYNL